MSLSSDTSNHSLRLQRTESSVATHSSSNTQSRWELLDEDGRFLRWAVGLILSLFGGVGLLAGTMMALFTTRTGPYIGTNGLLGWSLVFLGLGGWLLWEQRNLRFNDDND